ncbi:RNA polymerase sigma-70 factor [Luteipulveratus halotolerans]|uniref:RNA polymerase sigma24 factor n=1 Tax=Luteipulveratus halotolerans TaxID=1631356 RepID=A0A0L6CN34_9MICO|nr:RNA polymerase sigma-70 factor [Luteipulveratus halotolerans]KNX39060.1 RNA polymerase sigma24 factor [Luteipulveratus halotolerans]
MTDLAVQHDALRPLMFSIAYRMLGSVAEAEDVVQDAFLRLHQSTPADVRSLEAYASTVTTRIAVDVLRSARHQRETYVGSWLPEPLLADDPDPAHRIEMDETVSVAFLMVLERLSPLERAVFVLREAFDHPYPRIAEILQRSEASCRQLLARARQHIQAAQPRFEPDPLQRKQIAAAFISAVQDGQLGDLERLLADDVTFHGDGGGKAPAITSPRVGRTTVARFIAGLLRQGARLGVAAAVVDANGQPALRINGPDGAVLSVLSVEVADGRVIGVHNQLNPDKLHHLGHVGDMYALLRNAD